MDSIPERTKAAVRKKRLATRHVCLHSLPWQLYLPVYYSSKPTAFLGRFKAKKKLTNAYYILI